MADVIISPNMALPVPVVGIDLGPDWATNINSCLSAIDSHAHTPGQGVPITVQALDINADLPINGNNLTTARSLRFTPQSAALSNPADLGCLYEVNADLFYNDGSGNQIRLTQSGAPAGATGTITGLPSGTASASYSAGTFVFQSATATAANVDGASYVFRNSTASSFGLTLSPPNAMGANYALTLPTLPPAQQFMTLDAAGNMGAPWAVDGSTIVISSNFVSVAPNADFPGNNTRVNGGDIVTSLVNPATHGLSIIRGVYNSGGSGTIVAGEGFTIVKSATGAVSVVFTSVFLDQPSFVGTVTSNGSDRIVVACSSVGTTGAAVFTASESFGPQDCEVSFIAIGQRP